MSEPKRRLSPIIKSASFGWVVENFIGPNVYTGEETELLTDQGVHWVFPRLEDVPPKWRQYAREATQLEATTGKRAPYRVNIVKETVIE